MAAASLGSATGSRVDSAAKHTMACKMDTRFFRCGFEQGGEFADNILHQNKMKFAMQKDEIVMNTTKKFLSVPGSQAYPLVVTTLGDFASGLMQEFLLWLYSSQSADSFIKRSSKTCADRDEHIKALDKNNQFSVFESRLHYLPEFRCQGVALGQAFASHISGDTVATVLVGGMVTVMNGHFEMFAGMLGVRAACRVVLVFFLLLTQVSLAGDEVQWYFDFEESQFCPKSNSAQDEGTRKFDLKKNPLLPSLAKKMKFFENRLMGSQQGIGNSNGLKNANTIFRIKSYRNAIKMDEDTPFHYPHFGDKSRVFAKCIVGGRAGDMVDLMICTQSS